MKRGCLVIALMLCAIAVAAQQANSPTNLNLRQEFPVLLKHSLTAGESAVGTPVDASLVAATLVHGTVILAGAHFFGQVEESIAASAESPALIVVHFAAVRWDKKTVPVDLYLTNAYYPRPPESGPGMRRIVNTDMLRFMADGQVLSPATQLAIASRPEEWPSRVLIPSTASILTEDGSTAIVSSKKKLRLDRELTYCLEGVVGEFNTASAKMR